jgi:hypothetical protein
MQQFCAHKEELLRVLDVPQVPLIPMRGRQIFGSMSPGARLAAALAMRMDAAPVIRIRGFACRKLAYSFWQYLLSRLRGDESVPYLPDVD